MSITTLWSFQPNFPGTDAFVGAANPLQYEWVSLWNYSLDPEPVAFKVTVMVDDVNVVEQKIGYREQGEVFGLGARVFYVDIGEILMGQIQSPDPTGAIGGTSAIADITPECLKEVYITCECYVTDSATAEIVPDSSGDTTSERTWAIIGGTDIYDGLWQPDYAGHIHEIGNSATNGYMLPLSNKPTKAYAIRGSAERISYICNNPHVGLNSVAIFYTLEDGTIDGAVYSTPAYGVAPGSPLYVNQPIGPDSIFSGTLLAGVAPLLNVVNYQFLFGFWDGSAFTQQSAVYYREVITDTFDQWGAPFEIVARNRLGAFDTYVVWSGLRLSDSNQSGDLYQLATTNWYEQNVAALQRGWSRVNQQSQRHWSVVQDMTTAGQQWLTEIFASGLAWLNVPNTSGVIWFIPITIDDQQAERFQFDKDSARLAVSIGGRFAMTEPMIK